MTFYASDSRTLTTKAFAKKADAKAWVKYMNKEHEIFEKNGTWYNEKSGQPVMESPAMIFELDESQDDPEWIEHVKSLPIE